jgi:hypothetical protein
VARGIFSTVPILLKQPHRPQMPINQYLAAISPKWTRHALPHRRSLWRYGKPASSPMALPGESCRAGSCGNRNLEVIIANDHDEPVAPGEVAETLVAEMGLRNADGLLQ